jgi:amino acid transporter
VTAQSATPGAPAQLRRDSLGLPELVFQGVTHIAPAVNIIFTFPIIALKAGPTMPLSLLLATVVCLLIANTVSQFSRYVPSSGGYYAFATRGLGARGGFIATWSFLIYDITGPAGATGFLGYLIADMLRVQFGLGVPWWLLALLMFAVIFVLTRHGIRLSMRITGLLGGLELLIMLALAVSFMLHPGPGSSYLAPLSPSKAPNHLGGIIAGMVFAILALSGFEAPAPLAQESRDPDRLVGRAVILSLLAIGGFYVFTSYASAIGWGTGNMAAFASNPNPYYALARALWGGGWWLVAFALINSAVACGLASTNSASRVMYTMGRAGTLPAAFGRIHPVHQTPTFAIGAVQLLGFGAVLIVGLLLRPEDVFGFLGTISALAAIVLYCMANLALTSYMRRAHRDRFTLWQHVVVPWAATVGLLPVLFITLYPVPDWPYDIAPYLFGFILLLGFAYMQWLEAREPGALRRGASLLVGADSRAGPAQFQQRVKAADEPPAQAGASTANHRFLVWVGYGQYGFMGTLAIAGMIFMLLRAMHPGAVAGAGRSTALGFATLFATICGYCVWRLRLHFRRHSA